MGLNFKDTEEAVSSNVVYVGTGIHDFKVEKIYFQPVGESVNGEIKKDKSPVSFTLEQIRVQLSCIKTYAGKDSAGGSVTVSVLAPKTDTPEKTKGGLQRIMHIFANMTTADKKDKATAYIKAIDAPTLEAFAKKLKPFEGKTVRYKLIADQNGKYAQLPNYYGGFAEPADVAFESSSLKYDPAKEGTKTQPKNAEPVDSEVAVAVSDTDDLPF